VEAADERTAISNILKDKESSEEESNAFKDASRVEASTELESIEPSSSALSVGEGVDLLASSKA